MTVRTRPWWLVALLVVVGVANGIGALGSVADAHLYQETAISLPVIFPVVVAAFWATILPALAWGLLRRSAWAYRWTTPVITLYATIRTVLYAMLASADFDQGRIIAQVILSFAILAPIWFVTVRRGWHKIGLTQDATLTRSDREH